MTSEHHIIRELIIHGLAFCAAAAIGAILIYPYYGILEHDTDSAGGAREAYLGCVVIAGGVGPAITIFLLWLGKTIRKIRRG